jgi:sulfite reductase (NADPH) flavoprotein alpha-component
VLSLRPVGAALAPLSGQVAVDVPALLRLTARLEAVSPIGGMTVSDGGWAIDVISADGKVDGRWDIGTGEPMDEPFSAADVFRVAESLHRSLLPGLGVVVQIASFAMLGTLAAGPVLAWPRFRNSLLGWHRAVGWCLLPVTILSPLTAVLMTLGVGEAALPIASHPVTMTEALSAAAARVDLGHLVTAHRSHGGIVLVQAADEVFAVDGQGRLAPLGGPGVVREIHEGVWAGAWSGVLNFVVSLGLLGLTVTGLMAWARRPPVGVRGSVSYRSVR